MIPIQKIQSTDNPNASNNKKHKYVALIMIDGRNSQLYPLTKDYSIALLPIGNKKMILYQLESLIDLGKDIIERVYIAINQINKDVQTFIQKQFLPQNLDFPLDLRFIKLQENQFNFQSFQQSLQFLISKINFQNLIFLPCDTISSISLNKIVSIHETKKSDLSMLLKTKKQLTENDKKQALDQNQNETDLALIGYSGQVLALDMISQFSYNGFKIHSSINQRVKKSSIKKVIDSRIYIFSNRVVKIASQLASGQLTEVKPDFISTLIKNQTNLRLLNLSTSHIESSKAKMKKKPFDKEPLTHEKNKTVTALNIFSVVAEPDEYIKRISTLKIYENINMDSLIRGNKQKQILMPTKYTTKIDQDQNFSKLGSIIGYNTSIGQGYKIRRTIIQQGCKIGKNVQINNSVIMKGAKIQDGCKINQSVIGPDVQIGAQSSVKSCHFAKKSRLKDGQKRDSQFIVVQ